MINDLKYKNEFLELFLRINNQTIPQKNIDCQSFMNHINICNICKAFIKDKYNKNHLDVGNLFTEINILKIILYIGLIIIGIKLIGQISK